jgi:hypothetical protein
MEEVVGSNPTSPTNPMVRNANRSSGLSHKQMFPSSSLGRTTKHRPCSSVAERSLGMTDVECSIHSMGTNYGR